VNVESAADKGKRQRLGRLLRSHLDRPVGSSGVRRVRIEVSTDTGTAVSYDIGHAWSVAGQECLSVFRVLDSSPLAGTSVLMRERRLDPNPEVWIRPAGAETARRVDGHRVEDPILGTDFSYDDLRTWTPRYLTGALEIARPEWPGRPRVVSSRWLYRGITPVTAIAHIDDETGLVCDVSWFRPDLETSFRRSHLEGIRSAGGVQMPVSQSVCLPEAGFVSRMALEDVAVGCPLPSRLFSLDNLGDASTFQQALRILGR
jgi:hypothetical protein